MTRLVRFGRIRLYLNKAKKASSGQTFLLIFVAKLFFNQGSRKVGLTASKFSRLRFDASVAKRAATFF